MENFGMTTMNVKKINKNKVFRFIYDERTTCKLIITTSMQMGLSTVTQNIKLLEEDGLIRKNGFYESTGGRKADALEIVKNARISIGVSILKDTVQIVATNLFGEIEHSISFPLLFWSDDSYYKKLGSLIDSFIINNNLENILGVSIATQGIISSDGTNVEYGEILGNVSMDISKFKSYINYPCRLEHDSKTAGFLEIWNNKFIKNGVVLLLNKNLGGAIITNGSINTGENMRSGIIEHLLIDENSQKTCYCGLKGCLETVCSAESLEKITGMSIKNFFSDRSSDSFKNHWENYLLNIAKAIGNLSLVIDGKFILSGLLASYFTDDDVDFLVSNIRSPFKFCKSSIIIGNLGEFTQATGASLYFIEEFLKEI